MTIDVLPIEPAIAVAPDAPGNEKPDAPRRANVIRRLWRGRPSDPAWVRPALVTLLIGTVVLYIWGLGASGWANSFYSAAVQAGSKSWKAFFFGSSDAANFITVDKPPASLWVMEISARIFGVNAWSILVPQALEGVAAVGMLYAGVRRWFGAGAGLLAGAVLALTPVAALMFRFNNPDALLVLILTASAYAMVRALEAGSTRWLVAAAPCEGSHRPEVLRPRGLLQHDGSRGERDDPHPAPDRGPRPVQRGRGLQPPLPVAHDRSRVRVRGTFGLAEPEQDSVQAAASNTRAA